MDSPLQINLDAYQGPLDLLLDLIRKQQIDIYNIPIHKITAQYLDALHKLKELDIEAGGEFVLMASTLIHIKSKMLLPADPTVPKDQQEDPRAELVNQLLEHEKFKQAAQMLQQKQMLEQASCSNPARSPELPSRSSTWWKRSTRFWSARATARSWTSPPRNLRWSR